MLLVKTYIDKSSIHGIGLFAAENISKCTIIWELQPGFDLILTGGQFSALPKIAQDYVMHYEHFDEDINCHVLCGDNARFFNKSENPNCGGDMHNKTIALRNIAKGEELTEIYFNFKEIDKML